MNVSSAQNYTLHRPLKAALSPGSRDPKCPSATRCPRSPPEHPDTPELSINKPAGNKLGASPARDLYLPKIKPEVGNTSYADRNDPYQSVLHFRAVEAQVVEGRGVVGQENGVEREADQSRRGQALLG